MSLKRIAAGLHDKRLVKEARERVAAQVQAAAQGERLYENITVTEAERDVIVEALKHYLLCRQHDCSHANHDAADMALDVFEGLE